ncbi:MAG: hypothetical protein ACM32H_00495 [Candidatus Aminicenantes bacterium RBG_16_66_30]
MERTYVAVLFLLLSFAFVPMARPQHDVPAWYIASDVTIRVDHIATATPESGGSVTTTYKLERSFSASAKLDLRNEGSVIVQTRQIMMDPEKMKKMSQAEIMKYSQDMLSAMQYTANWMPGPVDLGGEPDAMMKHMKASSVPVRLRYEETRTGTNVANEMGDKYDYLRTRTGTASGGLLYLGDQYKFEINTQSKKYWLLLPYGGQDLDPQARSIKWVTVEKTRLSGAATWGEEKRATDDAPADWLPAFKLDLPPNSGAWPVIEGTIASPDKITGEKTFNGSYSDGTTTVPITVTYRYTVSSKPLPPKTAAA